jgi:uncharacterized membrane protein
MQKIKFSERVPAKLWAILFLIAMLAVVAVIFFFVPGAWNGFVSLTMGFAGAVWGVVMWCIGDIRFIVGLAIPTVLFVVYATRKFWHKETALIVKTPLASTGSKLADVPGEDLFSKNVEVEQ